MAFAGAGLFVTTFGVLVMTGAPFASSMWLALFVIYQAISGALVWRWLRPTSGPLEHAGASLALGTAFAALAGTLTATLGLGSWGWAAPSLVTLVLALRRRTTFSTPSGPGWNGASITGFFSAFIPGMAIILYALRLYPLNWEGTWGRYHPDMSFFEAISVHIAQFGAFSTPFLTEGALRYHWLSYAWAGQLTLAADAPPFVAITRVLPVVALLGSAAMVASWTQKLSAQRWTPVLSGLLLSLGGFTGTVFGGVLTMDSPSQSMSVLWLIVFSLTVIHVARSATVVWPALLLVGLLAFVLVGAKVSAAAPAVAGVLVLVIVQSLRGDRRSLWLLAVTAVGATAGFAFFLAGSLGGGGLTLGSLVDKASSQHGLNPIDTKYAVVAGTAILVLAVAPRWAGILWLVGQPRWRWRPEVTYSLGLAASSLAALVAFNSFNEVWFSSTVSGPLSVITAVGAGEALVRLAGNSGKSNRLILTAAVTISCIVLVVVWALWLTGASGGNVWVSTWRWMGPIVAWAIAIVGGLVISWWAVRRFDLGGAAAGAVLILVLTSVPGRLLGVGTDLVATQENGLRNEWFSVGEVKYGVRRDTQPVSDWSDSQAKAAAWLRTNATDSQLVGTNLTLSPFVSAVSHMPTWVSGIGYQAPYGFSFMLPLMLAREDATWNFIDNPSVITLKPLCSSGVDWLWIDLSRTNTNSWAPYYNVRLQTADTVIAELNRSQCV